MASSSGYTEWRFDVLFSHVDPTGKIIFAHDPPHHNIGRVISVERIGLGQWRAEVAIIQGVQVFNHSFCIKEWLKDAGDPGGVARICALLKSSLETHTPPPLYTMMYSTGSYKQGECQISLTTYDPGYCGQVMAVHSATPATFERMVELLKL